MTVVERGPVTLLQYFTPTPLATDLLIASRTIRLESNSPAVIEKTLAAFNQSGISGLGHPQFLWRVVTEEVAAAAPVWPHPCSFSKEGLSFFTFGQNGFVAIDARAALAVSFLPAAWVRHGRAFVGVFLKLLLKITAPWLGISSDHVFLTSVSTAGGLSGDEN